MESLVLVPIGAALWQIGSKVSELRGRVMDQQTVIDNQSRLIEQLQQATAANSVGSAVPGPTIGQTIAKAAAWTGAVMAASLVTVNAVRLVNLRRQEAPAAVRASSPPQGYTPCAPEVEADACVICFEFARDTVVQPCGHFGLCWTCVQKLQSSSQGCPICREPIQGVVFAFAA